MEAKRNVIDAAALPAGLIIAALLPLRGSLAGPDAVMLVAVLSIGWTVLTQPQNSGSVVRWLSRGLAAALTTFLATFFHDGQPQHWMTPVLLAFGVLLSTCLLTALATQLRRVLRDQKTANLWIIALSTALCASPVWLYPAIIWFQFETDLGPALLWLNPLSYLATLADYDFLRQQWFYANSPLGSERYSYPNPYLASFVFALGTIVCLYRSSIPNNHPLEIGDS